MSSFLFCAGVSLSAIPWDLPLETFDVMSGNEVVSSAVFSHFPRLKLHIRHNDNSTCELT